MDEKVVTSREVTSAVLNALRESSERDPKFDKRLMECLGDRLTIANAKKLPDPCIIAKQKDLTAFREKFLAYNVSDLRAIALRYRLGSEEKIDDIWRKRKDRKQEYVDLLWETATRQNEALSIRLSQSTFVD
jgi:hypothetical protein